MTHKNYWIFQYNPKYFNLFIDTPDIAIGSKDIWPVTSYRNEIQVGDMVAIWQSGQESGIYALGIITTLPYKQKEYLEFQVKNNLTDKPLGWLVEYEIIMLMPEGIRREALKEDERFENLSILKSAMGTNFRMTQAEWQSLQELAGLIHSGSSVISPAATKEGYAEGQIKLVRHLTRERNSSLPGLKKAQFKERYGYLYCQKCGMNPLETYGEYGEACIEVHHTLPVSEMAHNHKTTLDDLICLCANCHRIEHALLSNNYLH